jgi:hypothetical protein
MRKPILYLLFFLFQYQIGHSQLTLTLNRPRSGDKLIKHQVEYKDPGKAGENILWDFSKLKTIDDGYTITYSSPRERRDGLYVMGKDTFKLDNLHGSELLVMRDHYTNYFYQIKDSVFYLLGYQNPSDLMHQASPIPLMRFPMVYGNKLAVATQSECLYSQQVLISTHGNTQAEADACGTIILPGNDTLRHVLRIHSTQTFLSDTIASMDSIDVDTQIDTYKWYARGYRYPVFETVHTVHRHAAMVDTFSIAFCYPPGGHLYLSEDPENLALLEELRASSNSQANGSTGRKTDPDSESILIDGILSCKMYPNPVATNLTLSYEVTMQANVSFGIYSIDGFCIMQIPAKLHEPGTYSANFNCTGLFPKNYILRVTANSKVANGILIKH